MPMTKQPAHPAGQSAPDDGAFDEPIAAVDDRDARDDSVSARVQSLRLSGREVPSIDGGKVRRRAIWGAAAVIVVALIWAYAAGAGPFAKPIQVDAITAARREPVQIVLDATGNVLADTTVRVSPLVAGRVVKVHVEEGQQVKKGDVLAEMSSTEFAADVEQAQAALDFAKAHLAELRAGSLEEDIEQAQANLDQSIARRDGLKRDYERTAQLLASKSISDMDFDRVKANYEEAEAQVKQFAAALKKAERGPREEQIAAAEADVEKAQAMLDKARHFLEAARIVAPIDGTVIELSEDQEGSWITPGPAAGFCVLADLGDLKAEIDVPEQELRNIELGQPCVITTEAYPDREYEGVVHWFSPVFNRQRGIRQAKIKILDPDEKLLPDMTCRVRILKEKAPPGAKETMQLPDEAIQKDENGQTYVYVLQEFQSRRRPVAIGTSHGDRVTIEDGVQEGETILLPGDTPLAEGQWVEPRLRDDESD